MVLFVELIRFTIQEVGMWGVYVMRRVAQVSFERCLSWSPTLKSVGTQGCDKDERGWNMVYLQARYPAQSTVIEQQVLCTELNSSAKV